MAAESEGIPDDRTPPAGVITDFPDLYPRQQTRFEWVVLNLKDTGDWTAYRVNLKDLTCDCADETFNRAEGEVCKHLAAAIFEAPKGLDGSDLETWTISTLMADVRSLLDDQQGHEEDTSSPAPDGDTAESEPSDGGSDEGPVRAVGVDDVRDYIQTLFAKPGLVEIRPGEHNGQAGTILEPDNQAMADHVYESFKGLLNSLEDSEVHVGFGDDPCHACGQQDGEFYYFVPEDDSSEVWE